MTILFVASGNSENFEITPFIKSQVESLINEGVTIKYFPVLEKGAWGYVKSARKLRRFLSENKDIDIIHSHYSLCGLVSVLAFSSLPKVHSFMGSDVYGVYTDKDKVKFSSRYLTFVSWLIQPFMDSIISKSKNIDAYVYRKKNAYIVPNGVHTDEIRKLSTPDKKMADEDQSTQQVLFLGDPKNKRKNYTLVKKALDKINDPKIELITPYPVTHIKALQYLKTADVFAMSSFAEGSPNVVKEAMACNCPMVVTDVGDASWVIDNTLGCYVSSFDVEDYASKLKLALKFAKLNGRTNGMERITELGLDSSTIAKKIISIYEQVLRQ